MMGRRLTFPAAAGSHDHGFFDREPVCPRGGERTTSLHSPKRSGCNSFSGRDSRSSSPERARSSRRRTRPGLNIGWGCSASDGAADADDSAMDRVWQFAADCAGTNVAVIAAENLGWVAEEWWSRSPDGRFNLEVLNMTGILSRPLLEQRMRLFFSRGS